MISKFRISAILAFLLLALPATSLAQKKTAPATSLAQDKIVPLNPDVAYGVLGNGMTYYILKNQKPANKAEIRLVVNAGSLMETDAQQGLAHFCEHMAFNGSANFEKNELVSYLQSVGVKFGAHLNAYTSFDETVYMISIPTDDDSIYRKGIQIMEDWAHLVSYTGEDIDAERGVVLEEYRLSRGANERMLQEYLPVLMAGSKYAERLPIGKKDVLEHFEYEQARSFYRDWYRPELMAIVVVGDIDVEETKKLIVDHFSGLKDPADAPKREVYEVPDFEGSRAAVATDVEAPYSMVQLKYNQQGLPEPDVTENDYRRHLKNSLFSMMLRARLTEISNQPDAPFSFVSCYYGTSWARTKEAFQFFGIAHDGKTLETLKVMVQEAERVKQFGFTEGEFERAVKEMIAGTESSYKDREKTESRYLVRELVNHYLEGELVPGIAWEYAYVKDIRDRVSLEEINALADEFITDDNKVAVITAPEKEGMNIPTKDQVLEVMTGKFAVGLTPYEDVDLPDRIMEEAPVGTSVSKVEVLEQAGAEKWILQNGVTVIAKKTDLKNDEIRMTAFSHGGTSLYDNETYQKIRFALGVVHSCGVGDYSEDDLAKIYSGKVVNVYPYIGSSSEAMNGNCAPDDLEDMFQLIHMFFINPRKDEQAFLAYVNSQKSFYDNMLSNPGSYYSYHSSKWIYNNHPRASDIPDAADWANTDYDLIYRIYKERFKYGSDFTFVFVGNFDREQLKTYCEKYLGGLPSSDQAEKAKDVGLRYRDAPDKLVIHKGMDQKSQVQILYGGGVEYDKTDDYLLESLGELLTIKLIEHLREEMSGVYGVGASGGISRDAYTRYQFIIRFPCGPENVDTLTKAAIAELHKIIENGPDEKDVEKVRQAQKRELDERMQSNRFWLNHLKDAAYYDDPYKSPEAKLDMINNLTTGQLQGIAKKYLSGDYLISILMPDN